jgi:hypothetical protein
MPEISFALILNENLKNKNLKIKQVESVIKVKGALDPYQIQKIRDHVSDSFQARRKTINDLIAGKAKEAAANKDPKKRSEIIAQVDTAIAKSAAAFDKKIQESITTFCEKDAELAQAAKTGRWSYAVNTLWDVGSLFWNGSEAAVGTASAMATGGATAALALKALFDLCLDFEKFCTTQADAWRGVDAQEKKLKAALDVIKKTKKGSPVAQSDIEKAESALAPLGPKIDVMEKNTRALAVKLDAILKQQIEKKVTDKKTVKKVENAVQAAVTEVAELGAAIAKKRKAQLSAKDSIKSAMTKAKADPWSYVTWARGIYESFNDTLDLSKPAENLYDAAKQLKIVVSQALEEAADD